MLEQLIESSETEGKSRSGYLLTTFVLVVGLAFSGVLWSLFAKDLAMGNDQFALANLINPIPVPENVPPPPVPKQQKQSAPAVANETTRQTNMLRIDENPVVPKETSTVPNEYKARPAAPFKITGGPETDFRNSSSNADERSQGMGTGIGDPAGTSTGGSETVKLPPPPPPPVTKKNPPVEDKKPEQRIVSLGVINGKAVSLPKPSYPAAATAVHAQGEVNIQILIDEAGNVVSAKAVSGHPLLRGVAENAARNAKFSPTRLSGQPVKVSGVIVYNFIKQ